MDFPTWEVGETESMYYSMFIAVMKNIIVISWENQE